MAKLFALGLPGGTTGGRVGGAPPEMIESHPLLSTHRYVLTLPADCASWTGGCEVSVLLRDGFEIGDHDIEYPDMAMRAIVHGASPRGIRTELGWPGLSPATLVECSDETIPLVRVDAVPALIQGDPSYSDAVRADGHDFLFQVDEEGWPEEGDLVAVIEDYLWGYGSVYFYGTPGPDQVVRDVVAGFIDF